VGEWLGRAVSFAPLSLVGKTVGVSPQEAIVGTKDGASDGTSEELESMFGSWGSGEVVMETGAGTGVSKRGVSGLKSLAGARDFLINLRAAFLVVLLEVLEVVVLVERILPFLAKR